MKAKVIILLVVCAVVTLSFTVTKTSKADKSSEKTSTTEASGPIGGMASEDPIN